MGLYLGSNRVKVILNGEIYQIRSPFIENLETSFIENNEDETNQSNEEQN